MHDTERSHGCSPLCRYHKGDRTSNAKHERSHAGRRVRWLQKHLAAAKTSRDAEEALVHHATVRSCTHSQGSTSAASTHVPFHSPTGMLHRLSFDLPEPSSVHLSFNQSQSSLPPLDLGGGNARPILSTGVHLSRGCPIHHRSIITICAHPHHEFL